MTLCNDNQDWDYISSNKHARAVFEPRFDNLHELVFIRKLDFAPVQQVFMLYPSLTRFETNDLWIEHPSRKGLWKIIGCMDDYVSLTHGNGLHTSMLEPYIELHELIRSALIGGHGMGKPMLLLELRSEALESAQTYDGWTSLLQSLIPYLEKANTQCHSAVQLSQQLVLIVKPDKPLVRTIKGTMARAASLKLYEDDINELYGSA